MDHLKDAFQKVKEDISSLRQDLDFLKWEFDELNNSLFEMRSFISSLKESELLNENIRQKENRELKEMIHEVLKEVQKGYSTDTSLSQTNQRIITTDIAPLTTDTLPIKPLKGEISTSSTGNEGVPTDRQTHPQTDRNIPLVENKPQETQEALSNRLDKASEILDSLDSLKKEIRLKFKRLTERELSVFSALYQLDEEKGHADYKSIAEKLKLTESSIRDYVGRLVDKGIPVDKIKINNKTIHLKVSESLKQLASLSTILQLRDL